MLELRPLLWGKIALVIMVVLVLGGGILSQILGSAGRFRFFKGMLSGFVLFFALLSAFVVFVAVLVYTGVLVSSNF